MPTRQQWLVAQYLLFVAFLGTAALNMLHVHAGFFTNYGADLVEPAWLYVIARQLHSSRPHKTLLQRTVGRTPEVAALTLFIGATLTEVSQYYWPHGIFSGRFDPLDILAYAVGPTICYIADRRSRPALAPAKVQ